MLCKKDVCSRHRVSVVVYLGDQSRCFRASLCSRDARWIEPFLEECRGKSETWQQAGHNPDFNEARLAEILEFIKWAPDNEVAQGGN